MDISANAWTPTHLYYFATPFIFGGKKGGFSTELFGKFCAYYVAGFVKVVEHFSASGLKNIFYPSSSAMDELPSGMGEYAAAKAAGETACRYLEKIYKGMVIHTPRLPRLATDQTVSLSPVNNLDPVPVLLKEFRSFK